MNIGIIVNQRRDSNGDALIKVINILRKYNTTPIVHSNLFCELRNEMIKLKVEVDNIYKRCPIVICLGGDGTILDAAHDAISYNKDNITLLGLNIGHLGFLTDNSIENAEESIKKLIENDYKSNTHMMLCAKNDSNINTALNDIVITKTNYEVNTIRIKLYINDDFTNEYVVDSLVISTPTGSTAYNLSLGGPVLQPDAKMIIITPAGEHSLISRPIVLDYKNKIKIEVLSDLKDVHLLVDGHSYNNLFNNTIEISTSNKTINLIKTNQINFYQLLKQKKL